MQKYEIDDLEDFLMEVKGDGVGTIGIRALVEHKPEHRHLTILLRLTAASEKRHFLYHEMVYSDAAITQAEVDRQVKAMEKRRGELIEEVKDKIPKARIISGQVLP